MLRPVWPVLGVFLLAAGCSGPQRPFVWADQLPDTPRPSGEYRIAPRDVIAVRVWNQDAMSTPRARVRDDGKISLPFLQDVQAAGVTPKELAVRLQTELEKYVVSPLITVTLEDRATVGISVLGEVARPGAFELPPGSVVLHALAAAGGLSQLADRDSIYVLRASEDGGPQQQRIRFKYEDLTGADPRCASFVLRRGDIIVVE